MERFTDTMLWSGHGGGLLKPVDTSNLCTVSRSFSLNADSVVHLRWTERRNRDSRMSVGAVWRAQTVRKTALGWRVKEKRKMRWITVRILLTVYIYKKKTTWVNRPDLDYLGVHRSCLVLEHSSTSRGPDLIQLSSGQRHGVPRFTQGTGVSVFVSVWNICTYKGIFMLIDFGASSLLLLLSSSFLVWF